MPKKPALIVTDVEELLAAFLKGYFADNSINNTSSLYIGRELPKTYSNTSGEYITISKITDNSVDSNFYREQTLSINCFASTWNLARKLSFKVEAIVNSDYLINFVFEDRKPVIRVETITGPIPTGSFLDAEAKAYNLALTIKTKSLPL